jgi:phosphoglycerate kinase
MQLRIPPVSAIAKKKVLVRVDYNVPLQNQPKAGHEKGESWFVSDDTRIRASLETIQFLKKHDASVILVSHLGRPDGQPEAGLSLAPIAKTLSGLLEEEVRLVGGKLADMKRECQNLEAGQVVLLENIRFFPEEEENDGTFSRQLAELAEVFINDAFSAAHRAHASTVGVAKHLPSFAGCSFTEEVKALS